MSRSSGISLGLSYTELNPQVLIFPRPSGRVEPRHPSIVLFFGWMDARLNHLMKYVEHLRSAFDTSTIIVVKATSTFYFTSQNQLETTLMPIVEVIRNEMSEQAQFRGVLVHVLSNGGGFQLMTLRKVLVKIPPRDTVAPSTTPIALVLDSTPGDNGLTSALTAMVPQHPVLRVLAIPSVVVLYMLYYMVNSLAGHPPVFQELRSSLNAPDLLPTVASLTTNDLGTVPRLYVYSDVDKITDGKNVARHAREAAAQGFDVHVEKFKGTAHVAHMRHDPDRYWGAVKSIWARAIDRSGQRVSASL